MGTVRILVVFVLVACSTRAFASVGLRTNVDVRPDSCLTNEELLGMVERPREHGFVKLDSKYSSANVLLRAEAAAAFMKMADSARKCGIQLNVLSGFRSFDHQASIWERKWNQYHAMPDSLRVLKILEYSMLPGASRHHWGTEVDLNNLSNGYFSSGEGQDVYDWLVTNARHFGFYQPYTVRSSNAGGVHEEKWHWSYYPLSIGYLSCWNRLEVYKLIDSSTFSGFMWAKKSDAFRVFANRIESTVRTQ